jgi:NAD(P)H-dependent flavin oxidoreductase YrpB (nitropropane dioxygenase family)
MSSIDSKGKLNRRTALKLAGLAAGAAVLPRPSRASADRRENCLRTRLSSKFGLRVPLASAGMAFVALPDLAAAVSNAGAIGVYGVGPEPPPVLAARIAAITARTTGVFGVDFILSQSAMGPFTTQDHIDIAAGARVPIVVFHFDVPTAAWVSQLHAAGTTVWVQTGDVNVALQAVAVGADGIVAQGRSAGGHNKNSTIDTFRLVKLMRNALPPKIFILASGGIADGHTLVRAIRAGADGGWAGTVFVAATESYANAGYKQRLINAHGDKATILQTRFGPEWPGQPQRVLRVRATTEPLTTTPPTIGSTLLFPGVLNVPYTMPKYSAIVPTRDTTGDLEEMDMPAGSKSVRAVRAVRPAAAIVNDFIDGGRDACDRDDDDGDEDDDDDESHGDD